MEMLLFSTIKTNINFYMFRTQFLVKKDYFWQVLDFNFFPPKFVYEHELNYNKFYQGRIDCSYSLTLLDEINSLLHVALHSATVTKGVFLWGDLSSDQWSGICLDHGASKEPANQLWSWIRWFLWCTMIQTDPDRSWITDPNSDYPKGLHPNCSKDQFMNPLLLLYM